MTKKLSTDIDSKQTEIEDLKTKIEVIEKSESEAKLKIEKMTSDMTQKVEEGHDTTKKNFDIHNLNTELEQKLS